MSEWISVKDKLPNRPDYDWVLISFVDVTDDRLRFVPSIGELRNGKWVTKESDVDADYLNHSDFEKDFRVKVTHWMPLPKSPK